jgi:hypothetical protein
VKLLESYLDLKLPIPEGVTSSTLAEAEQERLAKLAAIARAVQTFPRRLGTEASPAELSLDKKRAKRIAYVAEKLLSGWGGDPSVLPGDVQREAAIVDWERWWDEHQIWLETRKHFFATWCYKAGLNGDLAWCKSAINRLDNEHNWFENALR